MKKYIALITAVTCTVFLPRTVLAAQPENCQPIYGGGETCVQNTTFTLDKKVQNPQTKTFVDTLNISSPKYGPNQTVEFQITVKNNSKNTLSNIVLTDTFPSQYLTYYQNNSNAKFDTNTKTLSLTLDKLNPSDTKTITIQGKVAAELPANQTICIANQAQATQANQKSQDTTQLCLQTPSFNQPIANGQHPTNTNTTKGGLPVYTPTQSRRTPATGPETLGLLALLPSGILGYYLRRKTSYKNA
jgi:uncharacterized repeat protein (TIGR01451 family)